MHSHRKKAMQNAPVTCLAKFYGKALSGNLISAKVLACDRSRSGKRDGKTQITFEYLSVTRAARCGGQSTRDERAGGVKEGKPAGCRKRKAMSQASGLTLIIDWSHRK